MRPSGKKVGKYKVATILATYDLDVRLDMSDNVFVVRVPKTPGEKAEVTTEGVNYETFSAATLEEVKRKVDEFLIARDTTTFEDVIEYDLNRDSFSRVDNSVGFDFRVARVSVVCDDNSRPKLEVNVEVDDEGVVAVAKHFDCFATPGAHSGRYDKSVPYTVGRWRKCVALRDGIAELRRRVGELFGEGGEATGARLDGFEESRLLGGLRECE